MAARASCGPLLLSLRSVLPASPHHQGAEMYGGDACDPPQRVGCNVPLHPLSAPPCSAGLYLYLRCGTFFCALSSFARRGSTVDAVIGAQFPLAQDGCEWGAIAVCQCTPPGELDQRAGAV